MARILDLGCGTAKTRVPDAVVIGLDRNPRSNADVLAHLDRGGLPFRSDSFDLVYCLDILEHVDDVFAVLGEIHRVTRHGGRVKIRVPHFSSADGYGDPTHKRAFSTRSLNYVTGDFPELAFYETFRFRKRAVRIRFWEIVELKGIRVQEWLGLGWLANRFPSIYERFLAFIFPAQAVHFELEVIKEGGQSPRPGTPAP